MFNQLAPIKAFPILLPRLIIQFTERIKASHMNHCYLNPLNNFSRHVYDTSLNACFKAILRLNEMHTWFLFASTRMEFVNFDCTSVVLFFTPTYFASN